MARTAAPLFTQRTGLLKRRRPEEEEEDPEPQEEVAEEEPEEEDPEEDEEEPEEEDPEKRYVLVGDIPEGDVEAHLKMLKLVTTNSKFGLQMIVKMKVFGPKNS